MEWTTVLLSVAVLVISSKYVISFLRWAAKRYRLIRMMGKIPGPPSYPLIGSMLPLLVPRNKVFAAMDALIKQYLPLSASWIGPLAEVNLSRAEDIEVILSSNQVIDKALTYEFLHPWIGTGLLTSTGSKWRSHRKMITPSFHFKILENFIEVFVEKSNILVKKLETEVGNKGFDIFPYVTRCTLDIICETAMGTDIKAQEKLDSNYVQAVYALSELSLNRLMRFWLYPDFIFNSTANGKKVQKALDTLHGFTDKVIKQRKALRAKSGSKQTVAYDESNYMGKKKQAFLDMLLDETEKGAKLTDVELREEVDTFMFEGHDTTSAGIAWALFLLGNNNDVQDKVYEELDRIFEGSDRTVTMRDLQEMKYLEQVIKETLRLYPSVPFIGRTAMQDIPMVSGGHVIPKGAIINVHIYQVHRDPRYFPDPEVFNPDNFLPERIQARHPYTYVPFSAGPRNCIGQKFALLEEKTVISTILRHFKLRSTEPRASIVLIAELILRPENGINVQLTHRNASK